jgi:hypothetical protein
VRSLAKVGTVDQSGELSRDVKINVDHGTGNMRLIAFIQEGKTGKIWGVGSARLSN